MHIPVSATDFMFDGKKLSDFGMMLCSFGSSSSENTSIGNKITYRTAKPPMSDRTHFVNAVYEEPVTASLDICKSRCGHHTEGKLSPPEISALLSWLVRKDGYHKLKFYQDGYEDLYFNAYISDIQAVKFGGAVFGLTLSVETDSPYAYMETVRADLDMKAGSICSILNLSDETGAAAPGHLSVRCLSDGDLCIKNLSDNNRTTCVKNCSADETITFDCIHKLISSSDSTHKLSNDFNYTYFRMVHTYGDRQNLVTANMNCRLHLEYNPVRKVGIL